MYILASQSPRRKELLSKIIKDFVIIPANINEDIKVNTPEELPLILSKLKAEEIFKAHQDDIIIAADTVVILDNKILGKPKNEKEAYKMLSSLSNRKHDVITGYTILSKEKFISRTIKTEVYFNKLDDQTIIDYIKTGSPFDKAGGYGIQDSEFKLVKQIKGSLSNVIGLPLESLANDLL
ncbi:MAG: Maf family protein [Bacilli bacterium]